MNEIGQCLNCGHEALHHPDGQCYLCDCLDWEMRQDKNPISEEFETTVRRSGNGGHIMLSKKWVGKRVRITVREIN